MDQCRLSCATGLSELTKEQRLNQTNKFHNVVGEKYVSYSDP